MPVHEHDPLPPEWALNGVEPLDEETMALAAILPELDDDDVENLSSERVERARAFRIEDDRAAEWAFRRLNGIESAITVVEDQADAWREPINEWELDQLRPLIRTRAYFTGLLADFGRRRREDDPDGKATYSFPSGTIKTTLTKAKVEIADEETIIKWVRNRWRTKAERDRILRHKTWPLVSALREYVTTKTEMLGGVVELACEHEIQVDGPTDVGDIVFCQDCENLGMPHEQPVAAVLEINERTTVVDAETGTPVEGARIEPARIGVTVKGGA